MAGVSTRNSGVILQREKLIEKAGGKLLTAIDDAKQEFYVKTGQRRASQLTTIPPTHHYRIENEDTSLEWGEDKVADINTILSGWSDFHLQSCCEGLDEGKLTISVVLTTNSETAARTSTSFATLKLRGISKINSKEKSDVLAPEHEAIRQRLFETISLKIGHPTVPTQANNFGTNPLKSDPLPPNLYKFDFSPKYRGFPEGEIPYWSLFDIDNCNKALDGGHLTVKIVHPPVRITEPTALETPDLRVRTPRQKRGDETRALLHKTIVVTLGRDIFRRTTSANLVNPTKDDPEPPNGYIWVFTENYPAFPENKKLKDWTIEEHEACRMAVEKGWVKVQLVLDQDRIKQTRTDRGIADDEPVPHSQTPIEREVLRADSNPTQSLIESASATLPADPLESTRKELTLDEQVNQLLSEPLSQLKNVVGSALKAHNESEISLREDLRKYTEHIDQLKLQIGALEHKVRQFEQGKDADRDRIVQARDEGRQEGQDLAMRLMKETDDAKKESELRSHFIQIARAREEGFQKGLLQAQKGSNWKRQDEDFDTEYREPSMASHTVPRNEIPNAAHTQEQNSGSLYENLSQAATTTTEEAIQETKLPSQLKSSPFRKFQAINKEPNSSILAAYSVKRSRPDGSNEGTGETLRAVFQSHTHAAKRVRSNDLNKVNQDVFRMATRSSASPAGPHEQSHVKAGECSAGGDIYGESAPQNQAKKTVLGSVPSSTRKEITEQWKTAVNGKKEWQFSKS